MFQLPPERGPEVNKFEKVSNDGHQMSLVGDGIGAEGVPVHDVPCPGERPLARKVPCLQGSGAGAAEVGSLCNGVSCPGEGG